MAIVPPPAFFSSGLSMPNVGVYHRGGSYFFTPKLNIENFLGPDIMGGVIVYMDPANVTGLASNTNSGLTKLLPVKDLYTASRVANRRIIMFAGNGNPVKPAITDVDGTALSPDAARGPCYIIGCDSGFNPKPNQGCSVRGMQILLGGSGVSNNADFVSAWTKDGANSDYWASIRNTRTYRCFDLSNPDTGKPDGLGGYAPTQLTSVASAALCISTPNSIYQDNVASRLYVHLFDGRSPDSGLLPTGDNQELMGFGPYSIGLRYCTFDGGSLLLNTALMGTGFSLFMEDCLIRCTYSHGLSVIGFSTAMLNRVKGFLCASPTGEDTFSFDSTGDTQTSYVLLADCEAGWGGLGLSSSANAVTGHGTNPEIIMDVNGNYHDFGNMTGAMMVACVGKVSFLGVGTHTKGAPVGFHCDSPWALQGCVDACPVSTDGAGQLYLHSINGVSDNILPGSNTAPAPILY